MSDSDNNNTGVTDNDEKSITNCSSATNTSSRKSTNIGDEYLIRIQQETNRIRQKREKRQHQHQYQCQSGIPDINKSDKGFVSTTPTEGENTCTSLDESIDSTSSRISWEDIVNCSHRSLKKKSILTTALSLTSSTTTTIENKNTLKTATVTRSSHRSIQEQPNDENKVTEDYLIVDQRGNSIAKNNHFYTTEAAHNSSIYFGWKRRRNNNSNNRNTSKMSTDMIQKQKVEHEAFCNKLIDEVLGKDAGDDGKVPMEKVMMIIWQFRDDKDVMKFMTRFVSKYAGQRDVFDGIEFYLPQLAHMIIHLETQSDDAILERFSLVIAQQSMHFALQLNWILAGAIEDYQPELPDGSPNPTHNPLYCTRCVKLLTNIERVVVYQKPRSQELQRLYEKGKITKAEMECLERADRRFTAMQITAPKNDDEEEENFGGNLKYKRAIRSSCFKFKRWKTRYVAIEERMLNCYNTEGGTLRRSMPIEGATIELMKQSKYKNMFSVTNRSFEFRMRASSPEDMNKWMKMLEAESTTGRVFGHTDGSLFTDENKDARRVIDELTPTQLERYQFYRHERDFVRRLTDIAEDLRFLERPERKKQAPGMLKVLDIPDSVYSPLPSSTDIFCRIHSTIWKDTKVFNTKARCPTVMYFLGVRGELEYKGKRNSNMDIAEYMHIKFDMDSSDINTIEEEPEISTSIIQKDGKEFIQVQMEADPHLSKDMETLVVKSTSKSNNASSSIDEGDEMKSSDDGTPKDSVQSSSLPPEESVESKPSIVWSGSFTDNPTDTPVKKSSKFSAPASPARGNRHLRKFLRESMVSVPRRLANRLEREQSRKNNKIFETSKELHHVPIAVERKSTPAEENNESKKEIYVGRSSVMDHGKINLGKSQNDSIDQESIKRAKKIVCGGETWAEQSFRMLEENKNKPKDDVQLEIVSFISKSHDDLRQEVFVMQMIHYYKSVFIAAGLPLRLYTYKILSTSASTGLLELITDSVSLDGLKKAEGYPTEGGLRKYFENTYGGPTSKSFKAAQRNFMQSLAAYSIVCYLCGLKDRHNGNIMFDLFGNLIHIDFGFAFGMNVGHEFTMERAPFKLTEEYVEVMGGTNDECYKEFVHLFVEGFKAARKNSQIALGLVEIMMYRSNYPCFSGRRYGGGQALRGFREKLMLDVPDNMVEKNAKALINKAKDHWGTRAYDSFQHRSNGYAI
mmetsp:Transcript_6690/g.7580  ORF Transcript_6690/g.7580 Transcript_6690/m.7580 type:complete len:1193 (+) Transcript_6690:124-3702(+)